MSSVTDRGHSPPRGYVCHKAEATRWRDLICTPPTPPTPLPPTSFLTDMLAVRCLSKPSTRQSSTGSCHWPGRGGGGVHHALPVPSCEVHDTRVTSQLPCQRSACPSAPLPPDSFRLHMRLGLLFSTNNNKRKTVSRSCEWGWGWRGKWGNQSLPHKRN